MQNFHPHDWVFYLELKTRRRLEVRCHEFILEGGENTKTKNDENNTEQSSDFWKHGPRAFLSAYVPSMTADSVNNYNCLLQVALIVFK